jgi:hypothetical protein
LLKQDRSLVEQVVILSSLCLILLLGSKQKFWPALRIVSTASVFFTFESATNTFRDVSGAGVAVATKHERTELPQLWGPLSSSCRGCSCARKERQSRKQILPSGRSFVLTMTASVWHVLHSGLSRSETWDRHGHQNYEPDYKTNERVSNKYSNTWGCGDSNNHSGADCDVCVKSAETEESTFAIVMSEVMQK